MRQHAPPLSTLTVCLKLLLSTYSELYSQNEGSCVGHLYYQSCCYINSFFPIPDHLLISYIVWKIGTIPVIS